jgi:hypothetical protein
MTTYTLKPIQASNRKAKHPFYRFSQWNGKIFAKRGLLVTNIKNIWPDFTLNVDLKGSDWKSKEEYQNIIDKYLIKYSALQAGDASIIAEKCHDLNINVNSRWLGIGEYDNRFFLSLEKFGFYNTRGIDINPAIIKNKGGMFNFRDYPLSERFDVIRWAGLRDYSSGGLFNNTKKPIFELFLSKVAFHLNYNGYIFFNEYCNAGLVQIMEEALSDYGFLKIEASQRNYVQIWRKPISSSR